MKLKFKVAIVAMACAAFVFTGCQENENNLPSNENQQKALLDWSAAADSHNPNDVVGLTHNRGLEYILADLAYNDLGDVSKVYASASAFYTQSNGGSLSSVCTQAQLEAVYNSLKSYSTPPSLNYMLGLAGLSGGATNYAYLLLKDDYPVATSSYNDFKSKVVAWEAQIGSLPVSGGEKSKLYSMGSTLRYSALAWHTAAMPGSGNGHITLQGSATPLSISVRDIVIAVVDAVGTVILGPEAGAALSTIVRVLWPA